MTRWLAVVLFAGLIFYGSSIPGNELQVPFNLWDKLVHATEYAVFAFLLARAFGVKRWWWAIVVGTLYGVSDEFHQTFTPHRSGNDLGDLTADLVGSIIGASVSMLLHKLRADGTKTI